jgi:hypothetical protein
MVRPFIWILMSLFLMGMSNAERREEQRKIQEMVNRTVIAQTQPSPKGSPRINRILKNSYTNCCTEPRTPKSIWREPIRPPFPTGHKRFYGGIPRSR